MQQCETCSASFADQDAYQIHLGVGAPAFHTCNTAEEMTTKGMRLNQETGEWSIEKSLIVHWQGWASLKSNWAPDTTFCSQCGDPVNGQYTHTESGIKQNYCSYCYQSQFD